jgi:hypothetical protein
LGPSGLEVGKLEIGLETCTLRSPRKGKYTGELLPQC